MYQFEARWWMSKATFSFCKCHISQWPCTNSQKLPGISPSSQQSPNRSFCRASPTLSCLISKGLSDPWTTAKTMADQQWVNHWGREAVASVLTLFGCPTSPTLTTSKGWLEQALLSRFHREDGDLIPRDARVQPPARKLAQVLTSRMQ